MLVHEYAPFIAAMVRHVKYAMGWRGFWPNRDRWKAGYFQTDLSASQRGALNSFASASTEPLSSFGSLSSSPLDWSARLSFGPAASSAVELTGLPIQSISRSDAPVLPAPTSALTSTVWVRSSAGKSRLGRLNVNFSFPVLAFHA